MKNILTNTTKTAYKWIVFGTFFWLTVFSVAYAASITSTTQSVTSWDSITANWYQDVNDKLGGISVSSGGNVGIWASSPGAKLEIMQSANDVGLSIKTVANPWANNSWESYQWRLQIAWTFPLWDNPYSYNFWEIKAWATAQNWAKTYLKLWSLGNAWVFNNEMTLTNWNVGIWTTTPSEKLEVKGHILWNPIVWKWGPSVHGTSFTAQDYNIIPLDTQMFNSNSSYMSSDWNNKITIHKAWYYNIKFRTITHNNWWVGNHIELQQNGSKRIVLSHAQNFSGATEWRRHFLEDTVYLSAWDYIQVRAYCRDTVDRYCWYSSFNWYTALIIHRLN